MTALVAHRQEWKGYGDFSPIPSLFDPDGDTVLIFLSSNGIQFYDKTSDPWYRATVPGDKVYAQNMREGLVVYQPEEAASPMGCIQQFQFCNPSLSSNNCGPLASWADAQNYAAPLFGITTEDLENEIDPPTSNIMGSRFVWLTQVLAFGQVSIEGVVLDLGPEALTSIKYLTSGVMGSLPINQWQLDVRYWWATYLASLQQAVVNTARGPTDPTVDPYKVLPSGPHARNICNNQVRHLVAHVWSQAYMKRSYSNRRSAVPSMSPSVSSAFTLHWSPGSYS